MSTTVERAAEELDAGRVPLPADGGRRRGQGLSNALLISPSMLLLLVFFVAPLYFIFRFSVGLDTFAATKEKAANAGELTSFSWTLWTDFFGKGVTLDVLGLRVDMPVLVLGAGLAVLLLAAVLGSRLFGAAGGKVSATATVLLLLPFLALPAGGNFLRLAEVDSESTYLRLFFKSVTLAMTTSVFAVLMAFPIAYFLAFGIEKSRYTWLLIVIAPFLTSYLLRVFAWRVILGDDGVINNAVTGLGGEPITFLLYSRFTVFIVLLYAWVPFVVLPLFISLENMDRRLLEAATDLGASRLQALRKVTLPVIAPGVVASFLFVFIPSIGEFVTPSLVGGTEGFMFGNQIQNAFVGGLNDWQAGSMLSLFLLLVVFALAAATSRFLSAGGGAR